MSDAKQPLPTPAVPAAPVTGRPAAKKLRIKPRLTMTNWDVSTDYIRKRLTNNAR